MGVYKSALRYTAEGLIIGVTLAIVFAFTAPYLPPMQAICQ